MATYGLPQSLKAIAATPTYIGTDSYFLFFIIIIILLLLVLFFNLDGLRSLASFHSELILKIMNLIESLYDSFYGGSACRKATTYTGQHKRRRNADIHALSGIRTDDPSV
jgi:hypothetical protein